MAFGKGSVHPSESRELKDEQTGVRVIQLTSHPTINHNLYFLTSSFTPDMNWVLFASYRSGACQFYKAKFPSGEIVQLTNLEGGVNGYSGLISRDGSELFYTAGGQVRAVNLETLEEQMLAHWDGASLGEVSLSASGNFIVTAMRRGGLNYLTVTKTDGSGGDIIFECPRTIIHPQFHPTDDNLIEYAQDPAPRMWLIRRDGTGNECLYEHGNEEFIVHETWLGETEDLVFVHWNFSLKRMRLPSREISTIADFNAWHIAPNKVGTKILCDTNHPDIGIRLVDVATGEHTAICYPQSSCQGSQWKKTRYALKEDFERIAAQEERERALSWMEMKADTIYGPQWTHPHPSFSADERWVCYTSDVTGHPQVYAAELPEG